MKKLIISVVIIAVTSLYFVVDAQKRLTFLSNESLVAVPNAQESEIIPLGTDIVKLAAEKFPAVIKGMTENVKKVLTEKENSAVLPGTSAIVTDIREEVRPEKITEKASELVSAAVSSLKDIITKPIEEKLDEAFCSQK